MNLSHGMADLVSYGNADRDIEQVSSSFLTFLRHFSSIFQNSVFSLSLFKLKIIFSSTLLLRLLETEIIKFNNEFEYSNNRIKFKAAILFLHYKYDNDFYFWS